MVINLLDFVNENFYIKTVDGSIYIHFHYYNTHFCNTFPYHVITESTGVWVGARRGRPEGKRPLGRPRCRWEDNIKINLQEVGWGAWIGLIWLRIETGGGLLRMRL
jgi:hypothetical protein